MLKWARTHELGEIMTWVTSASGFEAEMYVNRFKIDEVVTTELIQYGTLSRPYKKLVFVSDTLTSCYIRSNGMRTIMHYQNG